MSLLLGRGPGLALDVGQRALRAAKMRRAKGVWRLDWAGSAEMPAGLLLDSFTEPNVTDMPAFVTAVRRVLAPVGRTKRINVTLPDYVSRVSILDFDSIPGKGEEVEKMLRWRLRKLVPFDVDKAALRYQYLGRFGEREKYMHRFLVSIIKADILEQYNSAFSQAGLRPEHMEIASFSVWNLYHDHILRAAGGAANFALLNVFGGKITVIVFDREVPHFLRLKDLGKLDGGGESGRLDTVRVLRELNASLTFYRENYVQAPVGKVFISGDSDWARGLEGEIRSGAGLDAVSLRLEDAVDASGVKGAAGGLAAYTAACGAALEH